MKLSEIATMILDDFDKESSITYPKNLGNWGIEEDKIDELKRHLKKLKVELKIYEIDEDEFPTLHGKNLVEIELKSSTADARKVMDVIRRSKAFHIAKHHIVNLRRKDLEEKLDAEAAYNMGLSGLEIKDKDQPPVKNLGKEADFSKAAWFPGREELHYFEDLAKKQEQIWPDSADHGVVIDEKEQTEARDNIKELLDIYDAKISKGPKKDTTTKMFIPFEQEGPYYVGIIFEIYYHEGGKNRTEKSKPGYDPSFFSITQTRHKQKESGYKEDKKSSINIMPF